MLSWAKTVKKKTCSLRAFQFLYGACHPAVFVLVLLVFFCGEVAGADAGNRLLRMEVQKKVSYTRFVFVFSSPPRYSVSEGPGQKVFVTFFDTCGPQLKKFNSYNDERVESLRFADQGNRLRLSLSVKEKSPGLRFLALGMPNVLTLDVGEPLRVNGRASMPPGRERIWNGAGKLVREFDPPLPSEIPFFPTPGPIIGKLLSGDELKLFIQGENFLYRERSAEAEEIFSRFLGGKPTLRAIAAFRLGEAQYQLEKYESALRWFREGSTLWPGYLVQSPSMVFAFADTLGRCGKSSEGRKVLERMISAMPGTKYGPLLLVRLADITARGGRDMEAVATYETVARKFPGTRAAYLAAVRLADRRIFAVSSTTYRTLVEEYRQIYRKTGDAVLKDEALFKSALIAALYGPADEAVRAVAEYQKVFPAGVFFNVAATIREDLLLSIYREREAGRDCRGLVMLVMENRDYLAQCVGEKAFLPLLSSCFTKLGMPREELDLFSSLVESQWVESNRSLLYFRIHEDAWTLGDYPMAAKAGRIYLKNYAAGDNAERVSERIGWIHYRHGDMRLVVATLAPLLDKKKKAADPVSYYYLGKACEKVGDSVKAEKAMRLYLASQPDGADSALTADARNVIATIQLSRKDSHGALEMLRIGYESSREERRDMFLYKMGEVLLAGGNAEAARERWQQLVEKGKDPVWKTMAIQALTDLTLREALQR